MEPAISSRVEGLIDAHLHLGDSSFEGERTAIIENAKAVGCRALLNVCTDLESLEIGRQLAAQEPMVYLAAATTPHDVDSEEGQAFYAAVKAAALAGECIAIGETGLDYHYEHSPRELQQVEFRRYIQLAKETGLPLIVHCRKAFADLFQILDEEKAPLGMLHCFTGTQEEALAAVERGWMVSFSGILTFKKSAPLQEVAAQLPIGNLLIETDAPYLAPVPYRGLRNEPSYVIEVARLLAELRQMPLQQVVDQIGSNLRSLFGI